VSNKAPSVYLQELARKNPGIRVALKNHLIPEDVADGVFDDVYELFLLERGQLIVAAIQKHVLTPRDELLQVLYNKE
jgi:hypothetical protein